MNVLKRPTMVTLVAWLTRGLLAAALLSAIDALCVVALGPLATSDALGFAHLLVLLFATYAVFALPLAALGACFDAAFERLDAGRVPAVCAGALASVAGAVALVAVSRHLAIADLEFPARVAIIHLAGATSLLALLAVAARLALVPAFGWVLARMPKLGRPRVVWAALALGAAVAFDAVAMVGLAPLHLNRLAGLTGVLAMALALISTRWTWPRLSARASQVVLVVGGVVVASSLGSCRNRHAQFILRDRSLVAGPLAGMLRDAIDVDRDGAAPTLLGGGDCDEGNRRVGPAEREIVGDGVDQDCRGGDAPSAPTRIDPPASLPTCGPPGRLSILLVTLDAVRADVLDPELTPSLARLGDDAVTFTRAYAQAPSTLHSVASLFTGRALSDIENANPIESNSLSLGTPLAERLRGAGYRTAAFNFFFLPPAYMTGFEAETTLGWRGVNPLGIKHTFGSAQVTNGALRFSAAMREIPSFAWLHYPDAHAPYLDTGDSRPLTPYEREVAYVDFHLGRLLATLEQSGLLERIVLVVTADHGEDLDEGGREGHGATLFERSIRVPLLVRIPGCPASRVDEPVGLDQIAPTLAAIAGIPMHGRSLFATRDPGALPVVSEALADGVFARAVIGRRYKLIVDVRNGGRALFDLEADPHEQHNVYSAAKPEAAEAEASYQRWLDRGLERAP